MSTPDSTHNRPWVKPFLRELARSGNVSKSATKAKIERTTAYLLRKSDAGFAAAWEEACEIATELMEEEARRRACDGTLKPVFHQGIECGRVREYSDGLLIFLLKARRPNVYRDNSRVEHTGADGGAIKVKGEYDVRLTLHPDDILAAERLEQAAADRGVRPDR